MNTITAIEPQKKRRGRRSVFVDGEFVVGVHEDVVAALSLSVGQSLDRDRLVGLVEAETTRKAREAALRLINYRDRSKSEIRKRLTGSDFPENTVEEVVDQLSRVGLLDDEKFSRDWVRSRTAAKPMGKARLAWELRSKGVEAACVEQALEGISEDAEYQMALSLAQRKIGKTSRDKESLKTKLSSFLQRRGFSWDVIKAVVGRLCPDDRDTA